MPELFRWRQYVEKSVIQTPHQQTKPGLIVVVQEKMNNNGNANTESEA
jgi:hypothetical protein